MDQHERPHRRWYVRQQIPRYLGNRPDRGHRIASPAYESEYRRERDVYDYIDREKLRNEGDFANVSSRRESRLLQSLESVEPRVLVNL